MLDNAAAIAWATNSLTQKGYVLQGALELVREMPWSIVSRFLTNQGWVYFKQMASPFAVEPTVIDILSRSSNYLPQIIDKHPTLPCFLMQDAGINLREQLKTHYQTQEVGNLLQSYAQLQQNTRSEISSLLAQGVPDWRLSTLPTLYKQLLHQEALLLQDGVTPAEIARLHTLHSHFSELCTQLATYALPETIEHCDFHDNNILIQNNQMVINDWGDTVISHPFFSLASWLNSASRHHGFTPSDVRYVFLRDAYLAKWLEYGSQATLLDAFALVQKVRPLYFTLNFSRVASCPGIAQFTQFQGYMAEALREFISQMNTY